MHASPFVYVSHAVTEQRMNILCRFAPSQSSQRSDEAWFVNALVPGAVLEGAYSPMTLTQGPMECAPIMCASCSAEVRRPLDPDNACLFIFNTPT